MKSSIMRNGARAKKQTRNNNGKKNNSKSMEEIRKFCGIWRDYPELDKFIEEIYRSRAGFRNIID